MHYYTDVLKKYVDFSGRARRQEFWMFFLFNLAALIVVAILDAVIGTSPLLYSLYALATFLPNLGLAVRRLHDQGKSGWWVLVGLIPLVGFIWAIVLMATEGQPNPNQYGPSPKAVHA
ncbi:MULTISPECIES: DUF805 domain-containing protein [unclassified Streptomyces]|uniref:DUF805 domain-containing protein n=1 Tax=unclassified Streptomyces TaxID=2593676 RepID=UPI000DC7EB97|nr:MULTISPECIES: DUF805 domain-containing protein [unclassified Streptomyces]AWZ09222.1 DUF805 domain-containing protein [Streptomyces sp. ICC4]AWZ16557.1 DUF805 domain-containing protein [Streptomyces sp. ICC1]